MNRVFIADLCRTPIGKMGGSLSSLPSTELGSIVIKELLVRTGIKADKVDHVIMGCVLQAGLGQNVARQAALHAGLPVTTTAETINIVCGSGLHAVNQAARMIQTGDADIVIAGGMESMSNAPYVLNQARFGYRMGNAALIDTMVNDALWDAFNDCHMGITAENIAEQYNLSREELDEYAVKSQEKAALAIEKGLFKEEIVPVKVKQKKQINIVDMDEGPRPNTTIESISKLKPVFKADGKITAGNSSGINDGAAAVILISEDRAKEFGIIPKAEWIGGTLAGVDPSVMGIGPVYSVKKLFRKLKITIDDIDLIEANEAFAAQALAVASDLKFPPEKVNVNGGAIALGHPVGASGCRILVSLIYEMKRRNASIGLATLCIGGGMGCSAIIKLI